MCLLREAQLDCDRCRSAFWSEKCHQGTSGLAVGINIFGLLAIHLRWLAVPHSLNLSSLSVTNVNWSDYLFLSPRTHFLRNHRERGQQFAVCLTFLKKNPAQSCCGNLNQAEKCRHRMREPLIRLVVRQFPLRTRTRPLARVIRSCKSLFNCFTVMSCPDVGPLISPNLIENYRQSARSRDGFSCA